MTLTDRIRFLEDTHAYLNAEIDRLEKTRAVDDQELRNKKKKRLQMKDELATLYKQQHEQTHEVMDWEE
jgi:hypothetical protein